MATSNKACLVGVICEKDAYFVLVVMCSDSL